MLTPSLGTSRRRHQRLAIRPGKVAPPAIDRLEPRCLLNGMFTSKVDYSTGTHPNSVAAADLNNDGKIDLAVACTENSQVSVLLNKGDGTFADKVDYTTSASPSGVAVADFNGDGKPDLAVAIKTSSSIAILLNQGNGIFAPEVLYATNGINTNSVISADFNADGWPDLAAASELSYSVAVLINKHDGTFSPGVNYAAGASPRGLASADFNVDGRPDIAVVSSDDSVVSVLLNRGDGTFANRVTYRTGNAPYRVTTGDFNLDGKPDLAVNSRFTLSLSILLNKGNGTFAPRVGYSVGNAGIDPPNGDVVSADFNRDGKPDIAFAHSDGSSVGVLFNKGNGTFPGRTDYSAGNGPGGLAAADFNRDGRIDLAATSWTDSTVSVLTQQTSVTINQAKTQADPSNSDTVNFSVVFSEPVTGFTGANVTLSGTAGATTATVTGSGKIYNVAVTGMTQNGKVIANIPAGAAIDVLGMPTAASTFTDHAVTVDYVLPQATLAANPIINPTANAYAFNVVYTDETALKASTIGTGDIVVYGPKSVTGYRPVATLIPPKTRYTNTTWILARYRITAPGGTWNKADNGTYTVVLMYKHVSDLAGNFIAPTKNNQVLGTFNVRIGIAPAPSPAPAPKSAAASSTAFPPPKTASASFFTTKSATQSVLRVDPESILGTTTR